MAFKVGATLDKGEIAYWEPKIPINMWMRIFPDQDTNLPPRWDDSRLVYCQRVSAIPFLSSKADGDAAKLAALRQYLIDMPAWVTVLYITDRHEPEDDTINGQATPEAYKNAFAAFWNMIQSLPAGVRSKVRAGPILTRQWTENTPGRSYSTYDPGVGDFFGVDMYVNSWSTTDPTAVATSYPNAVTFLSKVKAYRYNSSDTRPRIFPELGGIGIPADTTGAMRAAFLQAVVDELNTWTVAAQHWRFDGFIWWNKEGKSGKALTGAGTKRWFHLDRRHAGAGTTADPYTWALLPGTPALPLEKFNDIAAANYTPDPPPENPEDPPPDPEDPPEEPGGGGVTPPTGPPTSLPVDGPVAARLLAADYTILVTNPALEVVGDPLHGWQSLQATLRWKEPGSGQITIPAYRYIRDQLRPGYRIVILRRVLGRQHLLIGGPVKQKLRERDLDGDKGGVGLMTITFDDDLSSIEAFDARPNPALTLEAQTTDYWTYTGNPELGMLQLVDAQCGPSARPERRIPHLVVAPFSGVEGTGTVALGPTTDVNPRERLEPLTTVLRKMASLGVGDGFDPDSLGFRARQTVADGQRVILFEVLRSKDKRGLVHFSRNRGNLKFYSMEENAATLTHLAVGGSGEGADRFLREFTTPSSASLEWGRFEGYVPRPGTDTLAEMQAAATDEFAEKGASIRMALSAADTVDCRALVHYEPGDIVSAELDPGEYVSAPVQVISLQAWPGAGEVTGTTIGDQSARYADEDLRRMDALDRRVGRIERR